MSSHNPDKTRQHVLNMLENSDSHNGSEVRRIDTQVSSVFLAGDRVYKLKKPLRLPFIDHSTLSKRHASALKEVRINRRTAPDIYLGVAPVIEDAAGKLSIGKIGQEAAPDQGCIRDWLVVMRRFDDRKLLSRVVDEGTLSGDDMETLGEVIATSQNKNPIVRDRDCFDLLASNVKATFGGLNKTRHLTGEARLSALKARTQSAIAKLRPQIEQRGKDGKVRLCHGDMHLANIVMLDGKPTPFDALEFNDDLASLDTAMDVAFPLADLLRRGKTQLANRLMISWLEHSNDWSAVKLLPTFIAQRAQIRTMTAAGIAADATDQARKDKAMAEAEQWLSLSERLLQPTKPRLVVISGLSGSGKTTLARGLAHQMPGGAGAVHLTTDRTRKMLWGAKPTDKLPPDAYRPEISRKVIAEIERRAEICLRNGQSVVVDGIMNFKARRVLFEDLAKRTGAEFDGLWLDVPADELRRRVGIRAKGTSESDAGVDILEGQLKGFRPAAFGTWKRIDGFGTPEQVQDRVKQAVLPSPKPPKADRRSSLTP
ncbi:MAG: bifunctional aminoglycoside phosphotransferase/ATP-binding protein [Alphaproteobacteria bacterium]